MNHQGRSTAAGVNDGSIHYSMSQSSPSEMVPGGTQANNAILFLLKTRSAPHDVYADYFSVAGRLNGSTAAAVFVPVLEHTLLDDGMSRVRHLLGENKINGTGEKGTYGGAIFTSQRAVEAFAKLVDEDDSRKESEETWPGLADVPVYTVGPATSLALRSIPTRKPLQIFGSECGNGEALAHYMLGHYSKWHEELQKRSGRLPPVLFLVGETRRDIIPKTLMNPGLPEKSQIRVDEVEVYGTGVMESFEDNFTGLLQKSDGDKLRWVVVFSPTGCEAALRALAILDPATKRARKDRDETEGRVHIATIGPTTRDYLISEFGYTPDVVAKKPSPEGIADAISAYMAERGITADAAPTL